MSAHAGQDCVPRRRCLASAAPQACALQGAQNFGRYHVGALHWPFTDEASLAVESRMAASGAERLPGILDWRLKLGTALRVTAIMPDFDSELGHSYTSDPRLVVHLTRIDRIADAAGRRGRLGCCSDLGQQVLFCSGLRQR